MLALKVTGSPKTLGLSLEVMFMMMSPLVGAGGGGAFSTAQRRGHEQTVCAT